MTEEPLGRRKVVSVDSGENRQGLFIYLFLILFYF